ncbi:MAG: signal recognition particle-docking protein FtsY [Deltaproteobacteria bacterium]|nr:signal recognition particle-docking protein FtsY [Deltaproteobacteria bacterium]
MLGWFKKKLGIGKKEEPVAEEIIQDEKVSTPAAEAGATIVAPPATMPVTPADAKAGETLPAPVREEGPETPASKNPSFLTEDVRVLFSRLKQRLSKTRDSFVSRVDELFLGKKTIDPELLDDLEEILITADLGVATTHELMENAREKLKRNELSDPQALKKVLKEKIAGFIHSSDRPAELVLPQEGPFVIMVVGVNGVGKTTTIGKMAHKFLQSGQSVMLVAGDTFRAAAVEQLQIWGERIGVPVISQQSGADPSAVVFDALDHARKKKIDVVIVDTAGRLHTKVNLMEELKKIKRVMEKKLPGAPHEVMLVIDATTGQNGISQARLFGEAVDVTGLTLTKLDGTAKGGIVVNICREFNIPIRFIGIGEQMSDLRDFDADEFVEALFAENDS